MRRFLLILIAVIILGLCCLLIYKNHNKPKSDKPIIKIGATLPLSGNMSNIGDSSHKTLQMAIDKWNQQTSKYKYELVVEDDAFEAKKVASITNKLLTVDNVKAVLSVFSIGANVVSPITQRNNIIHMTCAYGSQPAEGFYNFNNITQYEDQTQLMLDTLKQKDVKSIIFLISNNIGSTQQAEILEEKIRADGSIEILAKEIFNPGTRNFKDIIQKTLRNGDPDIFYIDGITPDAELVAKYLKEETGIINLTTINDFIETANREIFEDLWFVESASGTDQFIKEFEDKYNQTLFLCGSNSYDNLDTLIWAYENTPLKDGFNIPDNEDVVKTLLSIKDWKGATGDFYVDEAGIFQTKSSVKIIKDGKAIPAGE